MRNVNITSQVVLRIPVAIELKYFADAITTGGKPEVDGIEGMKSEAVCMAVYESGWHGRPVTLAEIENCELEGYQGEN